VFDNVGECESFLEDGVDDDVMIAGPGLTQAEKFTVLRLLVGAELGVEIFSDVSVVEGFAEEDELQIFVEVQFDAGVVFLDGLDLSDEFFSEEGEGEFAADGDAVLGGDEDWFVDFSFDDDFFFDGVEARELDDFVEFDQEGFDDFDLNLDCGSGDFDFSEFN